jgi:hypothetical protein
MHNVRGIIVVVHVGAVKIYVGSVGSGHAKRKDRVKTGSNSVWHKKWCISEFDTPLSSFFLSFYLTSIPGPERSI